MAPLPAGQVASSSRAASPLCSRAGCAPQITGRKRGSAPAPPPPGAGRPRPRGAAAELYGPLTGPPTHVTSGSQSRRGPRPSRCRRPGARAASPARSPSPPRPGSTAPNSVLPPSSRRRGPEAKVPLLAAAPHSYLHRLHPPRPPLLSALSSFQRNFLPRRARYPQCEELHYPFHSYQRKETKLIRQELWRNRGKPPSW